MELLNEDIKIGQFEVLEELQDAFASRYPFLKIEFFELDKHTNQPKTHQLDAGTKLSKLPVESRETCINISSNRTIAEVTAEFLKKLGVTIKVSRKSGKVWNVITVTESWTLKTQNSAAEFVSSLMKLSHI